MPTKNLTSSAVTLDDAEAEAEPARSMAVLKAYVPYQMSDMSYPTVDNQGEETQPTSRTAPLPCEWRGHSVSLRQYESERTSERSRAAYWADMRSTLD
jgi:hypothetical protein